jgi:hypothetical protein
VELHLHSPNTSSWRGAQLSTGTTLPFTVITLESEDIDNEWYNIKTIIKQQKNGV